MQRKPQYLHAVMARSSDLDDGSRVAMGHPGAVLVPLALTMAELYKISGKELITALVAGYDIYVRLGRPLVHTCTGSAVSSRQACAASCCRSCGRKIMGETAEQLKNAMGIASLFAGSLIEYQNDGTPERCCVADGLH